MPTLGNTTRPAYVYDAETDTWLPIGVGAHSHDYTTQFIGKTLVDAKGDIVTASASDTPAILSKGADGTILVADSSTSTGLAWQPYGAIQVAGKNKILNGNMLINQRASTTTVNAAAGTYTLDRWRAFGQTSDGVFTVTQDSSSPSEFSKSLKVTVTTADTNITSSQSYQMGQIIEGLNTIDLAWGTSAAKSAILSFWVKSSVTGTFGGGLRNSGSNRSYPFSYTINTADTWEKKTVTIGAETTGTWVKDAGSGIRIDFSLGAGSDYLGTAGAWNTNNNTGATGQTNIIATVNATWFITGVQFEIGSVATAFQTATGNIQGELAACQRYYYRSQPGSNGYARVASGRATSTTNLDLMIPLPSPMRVPPTSVEYSTLTTTTANHPSSIVLTQSTTTTAVCDFTTTGITTDRFYQVMGNNSTSAYIGFSAEL
jgi:hypothetical protein